MFQALITANFCTEAFLSKHLMNRGDYNADQTLESVNFRAAVFYETKTQAAQRTQHFKLLF